MKPLKAWAVYEPLNGTTQLDMFFDTVEEARECMNELNDGGLIGTPTTVHRTVTRTTEDEHERDRKLTDMTWELAMNYQLGDGDPDEIVERALADFWEEENDS